MPKFGKEDKAISAAACKEEECRTQAQAVVPPGPVAAQLRTFGLPETRRALAKHPDGYAMAIKFEERIIAAYGELEDDCEAEGKALLAELRGS